MKAINLGENPIVYTRDPNMPVGLKVCFLLLALAHGAGSLII